MKKKGSILKRFRGSWKAASICALIVFHLTVVCLLGPWFSVRSVTTSETEAVTEHWDSLDLGLRDYTDGYGSTTTVTHRDYAVVVTKTYSILPEDDPVADVLSVTQTLAISALIFAILMLVFAVLAKKYRLSGKIGAIMGVVLIVLTLTTLIHCATVLPGAVEESRDRMGVPVKEVVSGFWGSDSSDFQSYSQDTTWGPGWGWYAMLAAFVLALIGTVFLIRAESTKTREPTSV